MKKSEESAWNDFKAFIEERRYLSKNDLNNIKSVVEGGLFDSSAVIECKHVSGNKLRCGITDFNSGKMIELGTVENLSLEDHVFSVSNSQIGLFASSKGKFFCGYFKTSGEKESGSIRLTCKKVPITI